MCKMLKTEPREEQMPLEVSDLTYETQVAFHLYGYLPSRWDSFGGNYLGKDLSLLSFLFKEFNISKAERRYILKIIPSIDEFVAEDIRRQLNAKKRKGELPSGGRNS